MSQIAHRQRLRERAEARETEFDESFHSFEPATTAATPAETQDELEIAPPHANSPGPLTATTVPVTPATVAPPVIYTEATGIQLAPSGPRQTAGPTHNYQPPQHLDEGDGFNLQVGDGK
jgi:hypothetical protein